MVLVCLGGFLVGIGWFLMSVVHRFPVQVVTFHMEALSLEEKKLQEIVLPFIAKRSIFSVHLNRIRAAIQRLPSVNHVSIHRLFPRQLILTIQSRVPKAKWQYGGFLDQHGELFYLPRRMSNFGRLNLPLFEGPSDTNALTVRLLDEYEHMEDVLMPIGLHIKKLSLNALGAWRLELNDGMIVNLGWEKPWDKLKKLVVIYPTVLKTSQRQAVAVDLRYAHGMAIKWARK
jgi:cell division protein FtsQ